MNKEDKVSDICDLMELRKFVNWVIDTYAYDPDGAVFPYGLQKEFPKLRDDDLFGFMTVVNHIQDNIETHIAKKMGIQDEVNDDQTTT